MSEQRDDTPELGVEELSIPGLFKVELVINEDERGSFREVWQAEKMQALGLPSFGPVQWNVSTNHSFGTLRGIHAEPWDKFVTVLAGECYVAYVDLRQGPTFGAIEQFLLQPNQAVYIPAGVANSYQTTLDSTVYGYLVNDHWQPGINYPAVHALDPALQINWPILEAHTTLSDKDRTLPLLIELEPIES